MPRDPNIPDAFDVYTLVLLRRAADAPDLPEAELDALQARHLCLPCGAGARGCAGREGTPQRAIRYCDARALHLCLWRRRGAAPDRRGSIGAGGGRLTYDVMEWWVVAGTLAFPKADRQVGRRRAMPDD